MIKARLIGHHAELQTMVQHLTATTTVVSVRGPYPAYIRRNVRWVIVPGQARVYLEIKR